MSPKKLPLLLQLAPTLTIICCYYCCCCCCCCCCVQIISKNKFWLRCDCTGDIIKPLPRLSYPFSDFNMALRCCCCLDVHAWLKFRQ